MAMEEIFVSGTSELLKKLVFAVDQELDRDSDHNMFAAQLKRLKGALEKIEAVTCDAERMQVNDPDVKLCLIKLKEVAYDADDVLDRFFYEAFMRSRNIEVPPFIPYHNPKYLLPDIIKNFDRISRKMFKIKWLPKFGIGNTPSQSTQGLTSHYAGRENDKSNIVSSSSSSVDFNRSGFRLRYDNLSSHLKQCFSYFSLFPKDWKFDRETLIHMWMAEGFLDQPSNGSSLEDIGNEYFSNLLSCSLFQNVEYDDLGDIITFELHNSVHDFASSVVGRHEVTVLSESEYEKSNRDEIRRLQLVLDEERPVGSTTLFLGEKLRTIFCGNDLGRRYLHLLPYSKNWKIEAFWSLREKKEGLRLRVIHLAGVHDFTLPINSLIHLRYLHLARWEIGKIDFSKPNLLQTLNLSECKNVQQTLQEIGSLTLLRHLSISSSDVRDVPESIFKLFNLQTLDISSCHFISVLPTSVGFLQNLLSLDISRTQIPVLPDSITDIYSLRRLEFHHCRNLKALPSNFGALTQLSSLNFEGTGITELPDSISRIYNLQRLNFMYCKDLKALPSNLGALTQLRSLDLEGSGIIELPDSICHIYSLERLEFMNCSELKVLPHDFGALTQLRSLNLEGTEITELPESLTSNLWKFESVNIRRLEVLMPYLVRKMEVKKNALPALRGRESSGIGELAGLNSLRVLEIRYLENVRGFADAEKAELRNKQNLRELSLKWEEEGANNNSVMVLEDGLRPHPNLKKLVIESFGGVRLPKWMGSSSIYCLPHLVELYLSNCNSCEKLPALGLLPRLAVLWISGMRSIKCLGPEIYYHVKKQDSKEVEEECTTSSAKPTAITISFPSLTRLELRDMDNLKKWVAPQPPPYHISFPVLETLCIIGCSELISIPDFQSCTSLQELIIEDCDKLNKESASEVYQAPNLITTFRYLVKEITSGTPADSGIQYIAALYTERFLHIINLENVKGGKEGAERAKLKDKQHLRKLILSWSSSSSNDDADDVECIDRSVNDGMVLEGLQPHPNLQMLTISGFEGLKLPRWMGSSSHCLPHVVELCLSNCNKCEKLPALGMLPCLKVLWIYGMRSIKCLGQEFYYQQQEEDSTSSSAKATTTLFPSLVKLIIEEMENLEEWFAPPSHYISSPCLEVVKIHRCDNLTSVPDFRLCTSLQELNILDCYKLNMESTSYGLIQKEEQRNHDTSNDSIHEEEQHHDPSEVYQSPNSVTTDSGIQDVAALETEKFLRIRNLENVRSGGIEDAERGKLKEMQHLEDLYLSWDYSYDDECIERSENDEKVLEGLLPPPNLQILTISGFRGLKLPKWTGLAHCLPKLVELYLSDCNICEKLPALGMLPYLRVLSIYGMGSMKCLGQEFYYQVDDDQEKITISFPSLTRLELGDMDTLEELVAPPPPPNTSFPVLKTLCIIGCYELTSIPDFRFCTSLKELTIEDCDKLKSTFYDFIPKEEQSDDSFEVHPSPNSITTDSRYLIKEITSGTPEHSGIQDVAALETEKFLHIRNLENLSGGKEVAEGAKLKDKQHLEDLFLSWNSSSSNDDDKYIDGSANDENVLEGLQPHPNLKILTVSGFRGLMFPKWMGLYNYLQHLVELYFKRCNGCEQLPALGMLPCLRILQIKGMNSVQCLGQEFYYQGQENRGSRSINSNNVEIKRDEINAATQAASSSSSSTGIFLFPSLSELSLVDMPILEEWTAPHHSFISFPSLEKLIVSGCLRLKSIPITSCSSLKSLELCNTNNEAVNSILTSRGVEQLISLASVSIQDSPQLEFFPVVLLQKETLSIEFLQIENCCKFQGFRILDNNNNKKEFHAKLSSGTGFYTSISSLCSLKLFACPALVSLPDLQEWTSLTELWIEDCDKLKESFSNDLASLAKLQTLYIDGDIDLPQK